MKIIKYSNRKLYSKDLKGYVTLSELLDYVKQGKSLEVVDNTTKQDITLVTLQSLVTVKNDLTHDDIYSILRK